MLASIFSVYPTFLVFLAAFVGAVITMALMPGFIRVLRARRIGQEVRDDGPETHLVKQGTPTMGGLVMLVAVIVCAVFLVSPEPATALLIGIIVVTGIVGLLDDGSKVMFHNSIGLTPKQKLAFQFLLATVFCLGAVNFAGISPVVEIPFIATLDLGVLNIVVPIGDGFSIPVLYLIYVNVMMVGLCNAVNLTDGLDGLAAGTVMVAMFVMAGIAYKADLLSISVVGAALGGSCLGFLWFNSYPADIFMGDTGSLALGMGFGGIAVLTKTEFIVLVIGGLFVVEALSVILQVAYFKRTHKRILLMAPLHHHFEKKGWSETKVVIRFWIVSGVFASVGFLLYFVRFL